MLELALAVCSKSQVHPYLLFSHFLSLPITYNLTTYPNLVSDGWKKLGRLCRNQIKIIERIKHHNSLYLYILFINLIYYSESKPKPLLKFMIFNVGPYLVVVSHTPLKQFFYHICFTYSWHCLTMNLP